MAHDQDFLSFDEAVQLTRNLERFFNSTESDNQLEFLRQRFNLTYKQGFVLKINDIVRNHHECTGCSNGQCVLGCYMSHNGNISYWDKALTKIIGARLVVHEVGHVVHEQIFEQDLDPNSHFERSEQFAQYMENNFNRFMHFMTPHDTTQNQTNNENLEFSTNDGSFAGAIMGGIAFGLGVAFAAIVVKSMSKKMNGE